MNNNHTPRPRLFYHPLTAAACLLLTGLLIYANTFSASFVFDDYGLIVDNPQIMAPETVMDFCRPPSPNRPLAKGTFALNYAVHGLDLFGYHLVNILIHVITAWLVFCLTRQTLRRCGSEDVRAAFFAAMIWLVMPVHTQSVTYIVQRMNSLAAMFYLLSLVSYIQARELRIRGAGRKKIFLRLAGCGLAGLFGLASKETVATLPIFIFLYEWFFFQGMDRAWLKKHLRRLGLVLTLCGLIAALYLGSHPLERLSDAYNNKPFTPIERLLTQPRVVLYYLSLLLYPHPERLNLDYDFPLSNTLTDPISTALSLAALAALVILAAVTAKKHRLLSFSIFWFLGNLIIESSAIGLALAFEHRAYLPSIFPVMAGSVLLLRHVRPVRPTILLLAFIIGIGGIWTWQRNRLWQDKTALWQDCLNKAPANARACHNLGLALDRAGDHLQAVQFLRRSLELTISRLGSGHPEIANICNNLGTALLETELYEEAREYFDMALQNQIAAPAAVPLLTAEIHRNLGITELHLENFTGAIEHFRQALAIRIENAGPRHPDTADIYNNLGVTYEAMGNVPLAAAGYRRALIIFRDRFGDDHPSTRTVMNNLSALAPVTGVTQ